MKPSSKNLREIKKIFLKRIILKLDPTKKFQAEQLKKEINYNLKLYGFKTEEEFGKENGFCIDCGFELNQDNTCKGCGRAYGW